MTFEYTDPSTSEKDEIRFLLGDTDASEALLQDEEITYLWNKWSQTYDSAEYVASIAAETIAAKYAREAQFAADGVSMYLANVAQQFRDLAVNLRERYESSLVGGQPDVGGISPYEGPDPDILDKNFGTGMHDNPEVGRQNYGSRDWVSYGWYDWYNMPGV